MSKEQNKTLTLGSLFDGSGGGSFGWTSDRADRTAMEQ